MDSPSDATQNHHPSSHEAEADLFAILVATEGSVIHAGARFAEHVADHEAILSLMETYDAQTLFPFDDTIRLLQQTYPDMDNEAHQEARQKTMIDLSLHSLGVEADVPPTLSGLAARDSVVVDELIAAERTLANPKASRLDRDEAEQTRLRTPIIRSHLATLARITLEQHIIARTRKQYQSQEISHAQLFHTVCEAANAQTTRIRTDGDTTIRLRQLLAEDIDLERAASENLEKSAKLETAYHDTRSIVSPKSPVPRRGKRGI